jgi:hypothetical protein
MTQLLEKGKIFKWTQDCEDSFEEVKKRLTTTPILVLPDLPKKFDIYCDASRRGIGCVLMQDGQVVSYASRYLKGSMKRIAPPMILSLQQWFMPSRYGDITSLVIDARFMVTIRASSIFSLRPI